MVQQSEDQLTPEQLAQLVGFGICNIHTHPQEVLGFSDQLSLMRAMPYVAISTTPYSPNSKDFILLVDATAGPVTINLPIADKGREFYVIKTAGSYPVSIVPAAGETIIGSASGVTFSGIGTSIHVKAFVGTGYWIM